MGYMSTKHLSEEEIDDIVIAEADDDSAWEEAIFVKAADIQSHPLLLDKQIIQLPLLICLPCELARHIAYSHIYVASARCAYGSACILV